MAKETSGPTSSINESPYFSNAAMESLKDFWGLQMKIGQTLAEQTVKMSQTWTDYAYNQAQDVAKLSHDCVKQSLVIADDVRKGISHITEKVTKAN